MKRASLGLRLDIGLSATVLVGAAILALTAPDLPLSALGQLSHGARSFAIAVLPAALAATLLGIPLGLVSARVGRLSERLVTRLLEMLGGFPSILLVALLRALDPDAPLWISVLALAVVRVPETVRLVRTQTTRFRASDAYVAVHALGASRSRLFFRHMLPATAGAMASMVVVNVGVLAAVEAAMAFLGLGATSASWGAQLGQAAASGDLATAVLPTTALGATLLASYRLAEALHRWLAPEYPFHASQFTKTSAVPSLPQNTASPS
jgi:peptide/nickel transport system permease protein